MYFGLPGAASCQGKNSHRALITRKKPIPQVNHFSSRYIVQCWAASVQMLSSTVDSGMAKVSLGHLDHQSRHYGQRERELYSEAGSGGVLSM